ncbi:hypothetical protein [Clostridium butyricum]
MKKAIILILILSNLGLMGCSNKNTDSVQLDEISDQTTIEKVEEENNVIQEDSNTIIEDEEIEEEDDINRKLEDTLKQASSYYSNKVSKYLTKQTGIAIGVIPAGESILEEVDYSYMDSDNSYEGIIQYHALCNDGKTHFWYSLLVCIDTQFDVPVGITIEADSVRDSLFKEHNWNFIDIEKDKDMYQTTFISPKTGWKEIERASFKPYVNDYAHFGANYDEESYGGYFGSDKNGNVEFQSDIREIPKEHIQDCINELYAMKGYKFKEEPYKSRYAKYNGYIEDMDKVPLTKEEKALLDELIARKNF